MKKEKKEEKLTGKAELTQQEMRALIQIVATHPTPQGVGSDEGRLKGRLINKLKSMLDN